MQSVRPVRRVAEDERVDFALEQDFREAVGQLFAHMETQIRALLPDSDIQHVGSIAIPGSLMKGDPDVQVRVTSDRYDAGKEVLPKPYPINPGGFAPGDATSFGTTVPNRLGAFI